MNTTKMNKEALMAYLGCENAAESMHDLLSQPLSGDLEVTDCFNLLKLLRDIRQNRRTLHQSRKREAQACCYDHSWSTRDVEQ